MIYLSEIVGRRLPSRVVEGEINAVPDYLAISDDEYATDDIRSSEFVSSSRYAWTELLVELLASLYKLSSIICVFL